MLSTAILGNLLGSFFMAAGVAVKVLVLSGIQRIRKTG
jgi:hypothetical protein